MSLCRPNLRLTLPFGVVCVKYLSPDTRDFVLGTICSKNTFSCIDFQSFITDDLTNNSIRASERAICHLRINVGSHTYTSAKIKQEVTVWKQRTNRSVAFLRRKATDNGGDNNGETPEVDAGDCVLNVLGYLPREFFVDKYAVFRFAFIGSGLSL